jgi:hypothetical protein
MSDVTTHPQPKIGILLQSHVSEDKHVTKPQTRSFTHISFNAARGSLCLYFESWRQVCVPSVARSTTETVLLVTLKACM